MVANFLEIYLSSSLGIEPNYRVSGILDFLPLKTCKVQNGLAYFGAASVTQKIKRFKALTSGADLLYNLWIKNAHTFL